MSQISIAVAPPQILGAALADALTCVTSPVKLGHWTLRYPDLTAQLFASEQARAFVTVCQHMAAAHEDFGLYDRATFEDVVSALADDPRVS